MRYSSALVTGASGFIGRNLCLRLKTRGFHVIGVGHGDWPDGKVDEWGIDHWCQMDINETALTNMAPNVDLVFHCAGGSSVQNSIIEPLQDFRKTVVTTLEVLEYIRKSSVNPKIIFASSAGVYGKCNSQPINEEAATDPVSPYGANKLMSELMIRNYSRVFGIQHNIVRFFSVYGVGLKRQLLWDACGKFTGKDAVFFGTGEEIRDWIHVNDAADLMISCAIDDNLRYSIINGGTGIPTKNRQLLSILGRSFGASKVVFNCTQKKGDPLAYCADISRAKTSNWLPTVQLEKSIEEYARWYMKTAI